MEKLLQLFEKVKELFEMLKTKQNSASYVLLMIVGVLGAVLDTYVQVDINDGFIVVVAGLLVKLGEWFKNRGQSEEA